MDSLSFDGYTSYSDSSAPRTPSPHGEEWQYYPTSQKMDMFSEEQHWGAPRGGSLLQELYEHDPAAEQEMEYQQQHHQQQQHHHQQQQMSGRPHDYTMIRRATFPYVRHDREQQHFELPLHHHDAYPDAAVKLEDTNPNYIVPSQHHHHHHHHPYMPPYGIPAHPTQPMLPAPPLHPGQLGPGMPYPVSALHIQHTDDAASKETQYLRRRCFNCHTTEPPSWRRSTLNPGKIVCNKCGLYERTHLRPRPLRFDELRAGGKARKNSKSNANANSGVAGVGANSNSSPGRNGSTSPKSAAVKKEPGEGTVPGRRASVSSASSAHSGGASDWDDNGSAPPTSFNSPLLSSSSHPPSASGPSYLPLPPLSSSPSPPLSAAIRLPNAPLSDIASYSHSPSPHLSVLPLPSAGGSPSPLGLSALGELSLQAQQDAAVAIASAHSSPLLQGGMSPAMHTMGLGMPNVMGGAQPLVRGKAHTISTSAPYEAYLNASRAAAVAEAEHQQQQQQQEHEAMSRRGSVSSVYEGMGYDVGSFDDSRSHSHLSEEPVSMGLSALKEEVVS